VYTSGVEVWKLDENERVARFGKDLFFVKSIAFSPDGKRLLTSSLRTPKGQGADDERRVTLWRTSNFKKISAFGEHEIGISSACFSPNGQNVAFGSNRASGGVSARSSLNGRTLFSRFRQDKVDVHLHDVSSMNPAVRVWNAVSRREESAFQLPKGRVEKVAFSPNGCMLASSGSALVIWDFEARTIVRELDQGSNAYSNCLAFSPSGTILASGGGYQFQPGSPYEDCGVKLWDTANGRMIAFLPHEWPVHSLSFSPDGQTIVAGGESGELLMWNVESVC